MLRFTGWRGALIAAGLCLGAGLTACGLYPDPPSITVPPEAPLSVGTKVVGAVVNSSDGSLVTTPVTVRFLTESGSAAAFVQDGQGNKVTSLQVEGGLLNLGVADGTSFPVNLVVTASGSGYLPSSATLSLTGEGTYKLLVELSSTQSPPEGVAIPEAVSAGSTDGTGATVSATSVSTPPAPSAVSVSLPSGTTITDANGTPLTGALTAVIASFDPESPAAMAAIPGSLSNAVVRDNGSVSTGAIVVGGFSQILISDSAGRQAASFSQPLPAAMQLAATTVNPLTGSLVVAGDTVPLWSFDEASGRWNNEGTANVTAGSGGALLANFNITHLSGYAVAWFVSAAQQCSLNLAVNGAGQNALTLKIAASGFADSFELPAGDTSASISGLTPAVDATVTAFFSGQKVGSVAISNCSAGALNVTLPSSIQPATLDVKVYDVCSNDASRKTPVPTAGVSVSSNSTLVALGATGSDGVAHLSGLIAGTSVSVTAENRDKKGKAFSPKSITLQAGANAVEFDNVKSCTVLTGASGGNP